MSGSEGRVKSMQAEQPFSNISILKYLAPEINEIETALFDYCKGINSTTIRIKILSDFFGSNICNAIHLIDKNKYLIHQNENGLQIFEFTEESFEIFCAVEISFCTSCSKEFEEPKIMSSNINRIDKAKLGFKFGLATGTITGLGFGAIFGLRQGKRGADLIRSVLGTVLSNGFTIGTFMAVGSAIR
ncbi:MAG: Reactive oxygen species modulator 1 [Marteilia pararefringens]